MRILRLRLHNYRGIEEADVHFEPVGLTVVEGPNEVGKTSLSESVTILFKYLDSSRHREVEAVKPVSRDVGTEIELQAESGPYSFIYFKRFHKKPETTLRVTKPKPENYTGREAHERVEAILRETIDLDLWLALNIQQGEALCQANLANQTSLSAALDRAAGGQSTDPRGESIFELVREEYANYYTERGNEKKELQESRRAVENALHEGSSLRQQLSDLEQDIERVAILQNDLERFAKQEREMEREISEYQNSLDEIQKLETALETARLKLDLERKSENAARVEKESRQKLVDRVNKTLKELADLETAIKSSTPALQNAEDDLKKAEETADSAERQRKDAEKLLSLRRVDFDYFTNKLHLEQLTERKERIDRAREEAALAEDTLTGNHVNEKCLRKIKEAERALVIARAQQEAGSPSLLLRALTDLTIQINGKQEAIGEDQEKTIYVPDRVRLAIPGTIDLEITAGASAADLSQRLEEAQEALEKACTAAGVSGPDEARRAFEERQEALRLIENRKQIERDNLRDLTYEQLERKVAGLGKTIPAYPGERVLSPPLCPDLESAKREIRRAEESLAVASREWEAARGILNAAREVRDRLRESGRETIIQLDLKAADLKQVEEELRRARNRISDEELKANLNEAVREVYLQERNFHDAEEALNKKRPEKVKTLMETARGSLQTVRQKRKDAQNGLIEVQTRLKVLGEDGLHEKLHAAESRLEHLRREKEALDRRASAGRLLFETMKDERDRTRRAYVAPLKEKIGQLGRLLFDDSFAVEVSEDLLITSRTLDGTTVSFDSLSGGAKEQLSLIARLACAMIVGKEGKGAPLILDDVLGYTDPERLKLMGAVLAKAGQVSQIIILTCMPDRYRNVGKAAVVRMG
ncbi:MAG: AAA family ATPase [Syntrophales bacterium]|nr:AAA family ATPase [Syntrophales bacterium]